MVGSFHILISLLPFLPVAAVIWKQNNDLGKHINLQNRSIAKTKQLCGLSNARATKFKTFLKIVAILVVIKVSIAAPIPPPHSRIPLHATDWPLWDASRSLLMPECEQVCFYVAARSYIFSSSQHIGRLRFTTPKKPTAHFIHLQTKFPNEISSNTHVFTMQTKLGNWLNP